MQKPASAVAVGFDRYDKGRLTRALKTVSDKHPFLRLRAVLLVAQGMAVYPVAKLLGRTAKAVYNWVATYLNAHHPSALFDASRRGRPVAAEAITAEGVLRARQENPLSPGDPTTTWTVEWPAVPRNSHYGSAVPPRTLRRRMRQAGLRLKRPPAMCTRKKTPTGRKKRGDRAKAKGEEHFSRFAL